MQVDPRALRFAAAVTSIVLIAVLVNGNTVLLAAQALVFALATVFGMRFAPYGLVFKALIRPRVGPPAETEDARPPRFAQGVGLVFTLAGTAGYALGITWLGIAATAIALGAAFLNAAFGFCLGCEMYLLIRRITTKKHSNREVPA
ncbi:DUF4395 domain-containing protein [Actinomadura rayongensis]|uniref:DUF4395 family protein n=1 Tax=Actinomadura rayongensis TaxID=1429076 RepID=A0A6I4WCM4_9ACTN|nr:DUF4395 domain-containing protein [Actinomadura rayongensis]MXQ64804.1 DUF4395 family protein [Actinomadura rayongensis]